MLSWVIEPFNRLGVHYLYQVMRLRGEVFVLEQNCPFVDADGKDEESIHLLGLEEGQLVAYARLVPPGLIYPEASIGRVVTSQKARRLGYGKQLMQKALQEVEALYGPCPIKIGAQKYLKRFYESYGFVDVGQPYIEDGIEHLIMLRP